MSDEFVLGVDLDGVCADFYGTLRVLAAEWVGQAVDELTTEVKFGLSDWGIADEDDYQRLHRWAVNQRELFRAVTPIPGAASALRRLSNQGLRIRIITHRLYVRYTHQKAIVQTADWLDFHGIPYWDLCFLKDKGAVGADLYIEDSPRNIEALRRAGAQVIVFDNSTNHNLGDPRARNWVEVEQLVDSFFAKWRESHTLPSSQSGPVL